jgi:hypothetical protein
MIEPDTKVVRLILVDVKFYRDRIGFQTGNRKTVPALSVDSETLDLAGVDPLCGDLDRRTSDEKNPKGMIHWIIRYNV